MKHLLLSSALFLLSVLLFACIPPENEFLHIDPNDFSDTGKSSTDTTSNTPGDTINDPYNTDTTFPPRTDTTTPSSDGTSTPTDTQTLDSPFLPPWNPPVFDRNELPSGLPSVNIQIDSSAMSRLAANPWSAEDEIGSFVDANSKTYTNVELNYRGAFQLQNVIREYDLANWKVKFPSDDIYRNRKEWNYNYEPDFRQKMALDLLRFAGVQVTSARHVLLHVNGQLQGMYLEYEDPDSRDWLWDMFGQTDGDLYKAAFDIPNLLPSEKCFADFTYLGDVYEGENNNYICHYNKKTNRKNARYDYRPIGQFITQLNTVQNDQLEEWFKENFDVDSFISYLVVSNFIANWDSYPQRPKNFWVYQNLRARKMVFIPWDLDQTFHSTINRYNQMGTTAPVFYDLENNDYSPIHSEEGTQRPLARKLIAIPAFRQAYINRYKELTNTILNTTYLNNRLDSLTAIVSGKIPSRDQEMLEENNDGMKSFFRNRTQIINNELNSL